jgi:hypothetical protein
MKTIKERVILPFVSHLPNQNSKTAVVSRLMKGAYSLTHSGRDCTPHERFSSLFLMKVMCVVYNHHPFKLQKKRMELDYS